VGHPGIRSTEAALTRTGHHNVLSILEHEPVRLMQPGRPLYPDNGFHLIIKGTEAEFILIGFINSASFANHFF
jgi:hypothetical protein